MSLPPNSLIIIISKSHYLYSTLRHVRFYRVVKITKPGMQSKNQGKEISGWPDQISRKINADRCWLHKLSTPSSVLLYILLHHWIFFLHIEPFLLSSDAERSKAGVFLSTTLNWDCWPTSLICV